MGEESIVRGQQIITSIHSLDVITKFTWRSVFQMSTQQLEIDKIIRPNDKRFDINDNLCGD